MTEIHYIGSPPIALNIKRSARAKRFSLRISQVTGGVNLTVPRYAPLGEGLAFASSKQDWIRGHLSEIPDTKALHFGGEVLFQGVMHPIEPKGGRGVAVADGKICVAGAENLIAAKLRGYFKEIARLHLRMASEKYAALLGQTVDKITLRDTRSRWGSCTSEGNLMYSWRLIMAPPEVLDYVAAHEVCHLLEMNHSAAYWAHVASVCPDYKIHRAWLRKHGGMLHQQAV